MEATQRKLLKSIVLELRHLLEGRYGNDSDWHPGDLEQRLAAIGVRRDRSPMPVDELPHLSEEDRHARRVVDAYLTLRQEAEIPLLQAVAEFVRETAYTWANRLLALRCMEARELIDEVILQKEVYGGRSLEHHRLAQRVPELCMGEDDGLFATLDRVFADRAESLPLLFDPKAPGVALRPSPATLNDCVSLLSLNPDVLARYRIRVEGLGVRDEGEGPPCPSSLVPHPFLAPDALGWAYQYWNTEEKDRVFAKVRTQKGAKIEGADIIPATQLYTEPYMVKFLVQNSLGATWAGMHPDTKLVDAWEYFVRDADRAPVEKKPVREITFLDPACGSGHFLLEAFDLFYAMYEESKDRGEGFGVRGDGEDLSSSSTLDPRPSSLTPTEICDSILRHNLYGIDIDERAVQIAEAALWMRAAEKAFGFEKATTNLVATNIRLPQGKDHLKAFLQKHPEDQPLRPALEVIFEGLEHADELGSLLQIEEPVEKELRHLQQRHASRVGAGVQLDMLEPTEVQGELPLGLDSYDAWQAKVIAQLKQHFAAEAESADLVQAFFGQSASKGIALFDIIANRYDVVAANPPYMGSKNMGTVVRQYVEQNYSQGKRDLYAAFILRCIGVCRNTGRVAMVTQQSWMFLRSFAELRAAKIEGLEGPPGGRFRGILRDSTVETVVHLGEHAFEDPAAAGAFAVLFTLANAASIDEHRLTAFRLIGPKSPLKKQEQLLRSVCDSRFQASRPRQVGFLRIMESPICYWLTDQLVDILEKHGPAGETEVRVSQGLTTGNVSRFVRFVWETADKRATPRWVWYTAGGGFRKWAGNEYLTVDWQDDGKRLRAYVAENYPPEKFTLLIKQPHTFGQPAVYYGAVARGSLGPRLCTGAIFGDSAPGVLHSSMARELLAGLLGCRLSSFLVRALSSSILSIRDAYLLRLPLYSQPVNPERQESIRAIVSIAEELKRHLISCDPTERTFTPESLTSILPCRFEIETVLLVLEGCLEDEVFAAYGLGMADVSEVLAETGRPVAWLSPLVGYQVLPSAMQTTSSIPDRVIDFLEAREHHAATSQELEWIRDRLCALYEAGPGAAGDVGSDDNYQAEGERDTDSMGASIPIPTEGYLEELSQHLDLHPISIYWLLKEGIETHGWRCPSEERRFLIDKASVLLLQLLGHQWPKQIEAGESVADWADIDGIIPLTPVTGEEALPDRLRRQFATQLNGDVSSLAEHEFAEVVGKSLDQWLETEFFKHHAQQFKKRPIAWQLQSSNYTRRHKPAFACLVYYHRVDVDMLPKLRSQYVGPLRQRYETELRGLESIPVDARSDRQDKRRVELGELLEELKQFDSKLESIDREGFGPKSVRPALRQAAFDDAMLCLKATWLKRLSAAVHNGPLSEWLENARETHLDCPLAEWIESALTHLDHFCNSVGPKPPKEKGVTPDPDSGFFAAMIAPEAESMVEDSLKLACEKWWKQFDEAILAPVRAEMKQRRDEIKQHQQELKEAGVRNTEQALELERRIDELKLEIKGLQTKLGGYDSQARPIREAIEEWICPEAETWEPWLATQPMYDAISSLDGRHAPPQTVEDFIRQESRYAPDINDGVRVNIAPLQRAGVLAANVLAKKDADKAIADRIEWRFDERRWCREGKLPQPGWWLCQDEGEP